MCAGIRKGNVVPTHVGVVVKDIQRSAELWSRMLQPLGIGRWEFREVCVKKENMIVGEPFRLNVALAPIKALGSIQLELLEELETNFVWSKFLKEHGEGFHHLAFAVSNIDEVVSKFEEQGGIVIMDMTMEGRRYVLYKTKPMGHIFEFMEA